VRGRPVPEPIQRHRLLLLPEMRFTCLYIRDTSSVSEGF
jgi:hypothetical protein